MADASSAEPLPPTEMTTPPPVRLTLTPVFDTPTYDYQVSLASIQQLAIDTQHSIHESLAMGLTRYKPFIQFSVPIKGCTNRITGQTCLHLEDATVEFGYHDVIVYVANEIPYQSCGFTAIYDHEQKHIAVNQELLQEYTPLIQSTLEDYLNRFGVICTNDPDQTKQELDTHFQTMLNQWNEQIATENHRRQQLVDSTEEYQRITNSCNGEVKDIARQFMASRH